MVFSDIETLIMAYAPLLVTIIGIVTSFIKIANDKIISMDEYWADDSDAPQWRLNKHIGTAIK